MSDDPKEESARALREWAGKPDPGNSYIRDVLRASGALKTSDDIVSFSGLREKIEGHAEAVIARVEANDMEAATIKKVAQLIAPGAKCIDITFRKDGREYRFEADWIARLFRDP